MGKETYKEDEVIATIRWSIADVKQALIKRGIEPTNENIEKVLNSRFERTLQDRSIEEGWDIMDTMITNLFE